MVTRALAVSDLDIVERPIHLTCNRPLLTLLWFILKTTTMMTMMKKMMSEAYIKTTPT
jgi:hypothetical protein